MNWWRESLVFLIFCLGFASCQKAQPFPEQKARLSLVSDPVVLDPRKARDLASVTLIRMIFEGLTRTGKTGATELAAAKRVDVSEDGLVYTFHLRPSRWSNGDFLTASDFVATWKTILDPSFCSDVAYQLYPIKNARRVKLGEIGIDHLGVQAIDDQILVVTLEQPLPYFLEVVSLPSFFPVHVKTAACSLDWGLSPTHFVANGPFQLDVWKHSDQISLKKNTYYWEADSVKLSGIDFFIASPDTALRMYEERSLDWAGSPLSTVPSDAVAVLKREGQLQMSPFLATYFYRMNTAPLIHQRKNPLSDRNLRRALASALDREAIVAHILQGGEAAAQSLVPPGMGLTNREYCLDRFQKEECAPSQFGEFGDPLIISYINNERNASIAQAVQKQWSVSLGIRTELEAVEPKVFYQRISKGEFQIAAGSWTADFNDPINFLEVFKYKDEGTNNTGWESSVYIDLLSRSSLYAGEERMRLLEAAEAVLMEDMPIIPIFHYSLTYLKNRALNDVVLSSMGQIDFRWAHFDTKHEKER